mgnify:CR=1 FL=1
MNMTATPTSPSPQPEAEALDWPPLPTETEIYILPDGQVVIADLPIELAPLLVDLGQAEGCASPANEANADVQ